MNWTFTDRCTLTDINTGFTLHLMSGSWSDVEDVIPESPEALHFLYEVRLIREGLVYAEQHEADIHRLPLVA